MNLPMTPPTTSASHARFVAWRAAACFWALLAAGSAQAQVEKVNTVMANVQSVLTGVAVIFFSIAIMWAGFKMAFQHAKWSDISSIVIGGILVGGAAGFASWLIG
jgi:type IV secretion system protein VirB2